MRKIGAWYREKIEVATAFLTKNGVFVVTPFPIYVDKFRNIALPQDLNRFTNETLISTKHNGQWVTLFNEPEPFEEFKRKMDKNGYTFIYDTEIKSNKARDIDANVVTDISLVDSDSLLPL